MGNDVAVKTQLWWAMEEAEACWRTAISAPWKGQQQSGCVWPVPHLCRMMEEQAVRLRLVVFTPLQDSCRVNPKQMRQEQMVRLNFSRKQSRK